MNEYIALAQFFVIAPVCQFLLQSPRINQNSRQRGLIYAILFLLVTALLLTYLTLSSSPPSYYSLLSTPTTSSLADLKRAYKTAAIRLHPDKNPDASAAADFALLTRAYETLEKPESRTLYDRYGPRASDSASMPATAQFVQQSMMDAGLWYVTWIGLTYILLPLPRLPPRSERRLDAAVPDRVGGVLPGVRGVAAAERRAAVLSSLSEGVVPAFPLPLPHERRPPPLPVRVHRLRDAAPRAHEGHPHIQRAHSRLTAAAAGHSREGWGGRGRSGGWEGGGG